MTTVAKDAVNPIAMQIGSLIGLFTKQDDGYSLNSQWFNDPWSRLSEVPSKPELLELLATLMTSAEGTALGTPAQAMNRTWYPILNPVKKEGDKPQPTGLYLVTSKTDDTGPAELGIGALYDWKYSDFSLLPYAYFPLLLLPKDGKDKFSFILGEKEYPVEAGIDITGSEGIFSSGHGDAKISFDGFKAGTQIWFNGNKPTLDLTFINLQLPNEEEGSNRSLFDLIENASVQESITIALAVLGGQLEKKEGAAATAGKMIQALLELMGLTGPLPSINWDALVKDPAKVTDVFTNWLAKIAGDSALLKEWLNDWFCLFKGKSGDESKDSITGDGTRTNPFAANLLSLKVTDNITVNIDFTTAAQKSPEGVLKIYPGFRVSSAPIKPIESLTEFGVQLQAQAELLCYSVQPAAANAGNSISFFPQYSVMAVAANTTEGKPLIAVGDAFPTNGENGEGFSIDSICVGFSRDSESAKGSIPSPAFMFNNVHTSIGSWPVIDLTNFDKETIEKAIGPVVEAAINGFFGGNNNEYAKAFTTILGISKPASYTGEWPLKDNMLLSPAELGLLVKNPFAAIGAYYSRCLDTNGDDNKPLFRYLVPAFNTLLGGESDEVTGDGTTEQPWQVPLLKVGNATLDLALAKPDNDELAIAFNFNLPLPIKAVAANFSLHAAMMVLQLPGTNGSGSWNASWTQALTGRLQVKDKEKEKLETPAIGGVSLAAKDIYVEGGWKNTDSFFVTAAIEEIALKSSAGSIDFGNLEVSSKGWSADDLKKFTPAIVNGLGLLLLENGGKMGVTLAALLGTLPNLDKIFDGKEHEDYNFPVPEGVALPEGWPVLAIKDFTNPWNDITGQIKALYADGKYMQPLMRMLGWALTGEVPEETEKIPTGSMANPWLVNLPDLYNIDLLTWKENKQAGYGVQRKFAVNKGKSVQLSTLIRADLPTFMLDGAENTTDNYPGLSLVNVIQNPDGKTPLVDAGGLTIGRVQIGAFVQLQEGKLHFIPVFRFLESRYKATDELKTIELVSVDGKPQFTSSDGEDVLNALINGLMEKLSETSQQEDFKQLKAFLDILGLYDVLDATTKDKKTSYAFNPGAWSAILANPGAYFTGKTRTILDSDDKCSLLMQSLAVLLGYKDLKMPKAWQGAQYLLKALELAKDHNNYFIPQFSNWLALIDKPVDYLKTKVTDLFGKPDEIKELVSNLSKLFKNESPKVQAGIDFKKYFNVDSSGNIITVKLPTEKIKLGEEVKLYATLVLDVKSYTLTNTVTAGSRTLDSALTFKYAPAYTDGALTHDYGFYLETLPGAPKAFDALPLWPFPADKTAYLKQIGVQVPITLLSSFAVKYLNDFVAPAHPAVKNIFKVLGLTGDVGGKEQIKPLTGILMHPLEWLMSEQVLGDANGDLDLTKLGRLLYDITDAAGIKVGDVELKPYEHDNKKDGVQLTGLPWGVGFALFANTEQGANVRGTFKPKLPEKAPSIELGAGIGFGTPSGVGIDGKVSMAYKVTDKNSLGITAQYAEKAFTLMAKANASDFKLLPFGGLNQFINEGTANTLVTIIGDKLFAAYDAYIKKTPDTKLKPFVDSFTTLTGIKTGEDLFSFFDKIYKDPLGQFNEANIGKALPNIHKFLTEILKLQGFSLVNSNKQLKYSPEITALPGAKVDILLGLGQAGDKTVFGLWIEPVAVYKWVSMGLSNTGVGVVMPVNYAAPELRYRVNMTLGADFTGSGLPDAPRPTVLFGLSGSEKGLDKYEMNLFPVKVSGDDGTLEIALLPTPELRIAGRGKVEADKWMANFGVEFLVPFMANTALGMDAVKNWLDKTKIADVEGVPGKVLTGWGLLNKKDNNYTLANLRMAFGSLTAENIVTKLVSTSLELLKDKQIVQIGDKGGIFVKLVQEGGKTRYGLRIQVSDIEVTDKLNADGAKLKVQLGSYYANQTADDNWTGLKTEPGIMAYIIAKDGNTLYFLPKFELISVGLDFTGADDKKPLINANGVTIQAIQPRAYISLDKDGMKADFGAGMMLHSLGLPLGPGFGKKVSASSNPVAQNLLTSGGNSGKTDAVNPAFSVAASYVFSSKQFNLQLYDKGLAPAKKVWISVMRAFGPLQCRKVGIGWDGGATPKKLDFLFDGQVSLAGLMVDLVDLDIGIPVSDPTNYDAYTLDLAGLDVSFNAGAVSIAGGFLKDNTAGTVQYTGQALIQAAAWGIGAYGSYALVEGHPSLFIFAFLNAPLGGPPFFFVKGLAGGFGYNRGINLPPVNEIESFPFIAGIDKPDTLGGKGGNAPTNEAALKALGTKVVPPKLGSYWAAAGVNFTSFEIIQSKALLMVIFGNDFEIALLGVSQLSLPKQEGAKPAKKYVDAKMAFKVTYKASSGKLEMEAVLTSNSFVIDPACKLTGGMAFYLWSKDQPGTDAKAGDFVFTLGGYHPRFIKPKHYPTVPRLGFSWSMSNISIKGGAYFALTPSSIMAGGSLEAVYQTGNLRAWFTAFADFLIQWKPFYYDITVGVSVGASYTVDFIWTTTYTVELGADVHIWGPEMAGTATVHWWIISFTVEFGKKSNIDKPNTIEWADFKPYFLPEDKAPAAPPQDKPEKGLLAAAPMAVLPVQQVTHIKQSNGVLKEVANKDTTVAPTSPVLWQIGPAGLTFTVDTAVPLNKITINDSKTISSSAVFGIRPLGSAVFGKDGKESTLKVTLKYNGGDYKDIDKWAFDQSLNGMPESLWGPVGGSAQVSANMIPGLLVGFSGRLTAKSFTVPTDGPPMFRLGDMGYTQFALRKLTLGNTPHLHPETEAVASKESLKKIEDTVMDKDVAARRGNVLKALSNAGLNIETDGRLDQMAAYASLTFQSKPMLGELGSWALGAITQPAEEPLQPAFLKSFAFDFESFETARQPEPARLRAVMLQYPRPAMHTSTLMAATPGMEKTMHTAKAMVYDNAKGDTWQAKNTFNKLFTAAESNTAVSFEIFPGKSVIYDFDPEAEAPVLSLSGDNRVFAAWFDAYNQLLGSGIITDGMALPKGTAELILNGSGTTVAEMPYAYGWHKALQLTMVNPNALTGAGAIIVPDNPVRIKKKRSTASYGLIAAEELIRRNLVASGDKILPAGVKTILPGGLKTVAVLVQDVVNAGSVTVKLRTETNGNVEYTELQNPLVINGTNETALLYAVPTGTGSTVIYAKPEADHAVNGVMGLGADPAAVKERWREVELLPAITADRAGYTAQVTIDQPQSTVSK